jgi:hypothetical protein
MFRRSLIHPAVWTVLAALAVGCAAVPVETDYDPDADFEALRTFLWAERDGAEAAEPAMENDLLDARVRRAVEASLSAKGFVLAETPRADFEVAYHVAVDRKVDVATYVDAFPRGYRWGPGITQAYTTVREHAVGSLVIDVLRGDTGKLIWRGSAQARIGQPGTPEARSQRVQAAADAILGRFPPGGETTEPGG